MLVDVINGQKTVYFLTSAENRAAIGPYVEGARVLDAFCHTGGFSVHAGLYGAREIVCADISEAALELAERNLRLNGIQRARTVCANVFDLLRQYQSERETFDAIILDPPAFVKNRAALEKGRAGYKEINLRAL
jgi:23S rRNA (cytosine1962-C5)-methyltransferase